MTLGTAKRSEERLRKWQRICKPGEGLRGREAHRGGRRSPFFRRLRSTGLLRLLAETAVFPAAALEPLPQTVHDDVEDRRDVERQSLREDESSDHGEAQRPARFRARAESHGDRK